MNNLDAYNGKHAGMMAFVLGSGPSLNMLDLTPLKDYVTIAVNSAYVAFPDADYFISDDWSVVNWSYFFNDLRSSKTTIALLYEDHLKNEAQQFGDRAVLYRHRNTYHLTDRYEHTNYANHICRARTSAGSAVHVAHIMGCKKIILLGIDCCRQEGLRYFWGKRGAVSKRPFRNDRIPIDHYSRVFYENKQTDIDLIDIAQYWESKSVFFNKKCQVFNASPISILNEFPKIDLDQFIEENQEGKKHV